MPLLLTMQPTQAVMLVRGDRYAAPHKIIGKSFIRGVRKSSRPQITCHPSQALKDFPDGEKFYCAISQRWSILLLKW